MMQYSRRRFLGLLAAAPVAAPVMAVAATQEPGVWCSGRFVSDYLMGTNFSTTINLTGTDQGGLENLTRSLTRSMNINYGAVAERMIEKTVEQAVAVTDAIAEAAQESDAEKPVQDAEKVA